MTNSFDFSSYDCVGFDLDNTLAEYEEHELISLIYNILANFMVSKYNDYDPVRLLKPLEDDIDFIRKGLTIDIERGNVVSLANDGSILRASHGTRPLTEAEIVETYGPEKIWNLGVEHCEDFLATWNGPLAEKIRSSLDYFDICVPLLFARSIDSIVNNATLTAADVWTHVFKSLYTMFTDEDNEYGYYGLMRKNPTKYIRKRSPEFLSWLSSFKAASKITFLITGSDHKYAELVASNALGANWKTYFDIVIYYARKPGFFTQDRDFTVVSPSHVVVPPGDLQFGQGYREGNWSGLRQLFARRLHKDEPKCIYLGDNFIQDIYAPAKFKCCDTIAVIKELADFDRNDDKELFLSNRWGSVLHDKLFDKPTVWNTVLNCYSKLNVPSLDWFLNNNDM